MQPILLKTFILLICWFETILTLLSFMYFPVYKWCHCFWRSVTASLCCSDSPGHLEEKVSQLEAMLKKLQDDLQKVLWLSWMLQTFYFFSVTIFSVSCTGKSAGRKKYLNCSASVAGARWFGFTDAAFCLLGQILPSMRPLTQCRNALNTKTLKGIFLLIIL